MLHRRLQPAALGAAARRCGCSSGRSLPLRTAQARKLPRRMLTHRAAPKLEPEPEPEQPPPGEQKPKATGWCDVDPVIAKQGACSRTPAAYRAPAARVLRTLSRGVLTSCGALRCSRHPHGEPGAAEPGHGLRGAGTAPYMMWSRLSSIWGVYIRQLCLPHIITRPSGAAALRARDERAERAGRRALPSAVVPFAHSPASFFPQRSCTENMLI
jgi:hypothetical protein